MRRLSLFWSVLAVWCGSTLACGPYTGEEYTGFVGRCDAADRAACINYSEASGDAPRVACDAQAACEASSSILDPVAELERQCSSTIDGVWNEADACPEAEVTGTCLIRPATVAFDVLVHHYPDYPGGIAQAEADCDSSNGTWVRAN